MNFIMRIASNSQNGAVNRSKEKAKFGKCQNQLRQFYAIAAMYADDHEGLLDSYGNFLRQTPMLCPSDKSLGAVGKVENKLPTSFRDSPFVFAGSTRLDECPPSSWMLVEYEPYHDLSKKPGFERGKWRGRFGTLMVDGSTPWELLEQ